MKEEEKNFCGNIFGEKRSNISIKSRIPSEIANKP